uniref:Uncharacterized protein n=1 Tax=viral metagenome TaxID=1070528 RepID=A0A6H1ZCL2_9ZZZZ
MFSLLGKIFLILISVFLPAQQIEEVWIASRGLDAITPTHNQEQLSFTRLDNYIIGSKAEEDPKYTTLSVRPGVSTFLNDPGTATRGMFHYRSPAGDDLVILATTDTIFKSSGTIWTTLEAGLSDFPWEGILYSDPDVARLYLCNGWDKNKKFLSGQSVLLPMQNQDNETQISGTVRFVVGSSVATCDAIANASLEAGQYIKPSTSHANTNWIEITSLETVGSVTTLEFSSQFPGTTEVTTSVVRSNDMDNSRYITEFAGHIVTGYVSISATTDVGPNLEGSPEYYLMRDYYGVAQSFEAITSNISRIKVRMSGAFQSQYPPAGNLVVRLKDSISASAPLAEVIYPMASLPVNPSPVSFDFGSIPVTIGNTYYFTIERQTSDTTPFQIEHGSSATGTSYWTANSTGFDGSWNSGYTTFEITPSYTDNLSVDYPDTYIDEANPTTNYKSATQIYAGSLGGNVRKAVVKSLIEYHGLTTEAQPWTNVKYSMYKTGAGTGEITAARIVRVDNLQAMTWNKNNTVVNWAQAGCNKAGTTAGDDYTVVAMSTEAITSVEGYVTWEVTTLSASWDVDTNINYGMVISNETSGQIVTFESSNASSNKPKWLLTTLTGSAESGHDLYFEISSEDSDRSTVVYSKRFFPENYPSLNTFDIPGRIVGLAKTGGYLIVGGKDPDAMHFYRFTGDVLDGKGIDYVTTVNDITFGSSKSIAYPPMDDSFIFFSGLGIYHQKGLQTMLLSAQIREQAKKFSDYRDPRDYYGGLADLMPQATILPTKDTYLISVPNAESINSYIYGLNYAMGSWYRWTNLNATTLMTRRSGGIEPRLYLGYGTGQVYTLDTSGSTTTVATAEFFLNKNDITKTKKLNFIEFGVRKDNPLTNSVVSLEVGTIDKGGSETYGKALDDNATTDKMEYINFTPGLTAKEFKLKFTQQATAGAVSIRSIRYNYTVNNTPGGK